MAVQIFCKFHILTQENSNGTDCAAHLAGGRCFACPYASKEEAINGLPKRKLGICSDFEPRLTL